MSNLSALDKLDIAENIQSLLDKLESDISPLEKLDIAGEVELLLERLLEGDAVTADTVDINVNDQAAVDAFVLAEIERLGSDFTKADYANAMRIASYDARTNIFRLVAETSTGGVIDGEIEIFESIVTGGADAIPDDIDSMLELASAAGGGVNISSKRQEILSSFLKDPEMREIMNEKVKEISGAVDAAEEELRAVTDELYSRKPTYFYGEAYNNWVDDFKEATRKPKRIYDKAVKERGAEFEAWRLEFYKDKLKDKLDELDRLSGEMHAPGKAVIDAIMSKSQISAVAAMEYSKNQVVEPGAIASLKKQGYTEDSLRSDIADFYQIFGGKVSPIIIRAVGSKRAWARDGGDNGLGVIAIDGSFTKKTLWHEMGHHVEFGDEVIKSAASYFLKKRRESEKLYSLRSLTGNNGYGKDEAAYKDSFFDAYVGKHYRDGATEVISMGFECLSSPEKAAMLASKDKEHLELVAGLAVQEMRPLSKVRLLKASSAKSGIIEKARNRADTISAITKIAKKITLDKNHKVPNELLPEIEFLSVHSNMRGDTSKADRPVFIGRIGDFHVYKGKMAASGSSRRIVNGYLVVKIPDEVGIEENESLGAYSSRSLKNSGQYSYNYATGESDYLLLISLHLWEIATTEALTSGKFTFMKKSNWRDHNRVTAFLFSDSGVSDDVLNGCYDWLKANYGK